MTEKRILIVGGVAGGASCATRARRLSEKAEIILFERGAFVSFANCGLPYYVGDIIKKEDDLLVATPELFRERFNIDVRLESEVVAIDRDKQEIEIKNLKTGACYRERYDDLVLSPGASPLVPPLPGIDLPGIFTLRTIPHSRLIKERIKKQTARKAVIVGGGFIGLEMTENLHRQGLQITIVEMMPQLMPSMDREMASAIQAHLLDKGIALELEEAVVGFEELSEGAVKVNLKSGKSLEADLVLLAIGVRPEVTLAREAGLKLGQRGGIEVDDQMRTSDAHIRAVGDAVEVDYFGTGQKAMIPLAGPANRQGRLAADNIMGRETRFRGVQGTAVCGVMGLTVAATGPSEKLLKAMKLWDDEKYLKVYVHPGSWASYYPGSSMIAMKIILLKEDGKLVSAQAAGLAGVEKRIDVLAMTLQLGGTIFDLEQAELCYAPQYGSAKDPINIAGMVAANLLRGDLELIHYNDMDEDEAFLLDVRDRYEFKGDQIGAAINIPLNELRDRLEELPRDREIITYCGIGQRSYYAYRILIQNGFKARSLSGGFRTFIMGDDL